MSALESFIADCRADTMERAEALGRGRAIMEGLVRGPDAFGYDVILASAKAWIADQERRTSAPFNTTEVRP